MVYIIKFLFCGLVTALLFPPFLILPVGFIIFPYLFFLITDQKLLNASKYMHFFYGIFYGLGLNIIVLFWIKEPFYFNSGTKSISYISYLLVLYVSIYYGFAFFILCFFKNGFAKLILLPVLFVIIEILREKISFGFPWVTFSLISSANFLIVNLAFYVGTYGLSYIIIFIFLIPASIILLLKKIFITYSKIYLIISFLLIIICIFMVNLRLNSFQSNSKNFKLVHNLTVSLNQLNISQFEKLNTANDEIRLNGILELISNNNNDLILFSETDYPYLIRNNEFAKIIQGLLKENQTVIIGGIRSENSQYFNSLYSIKKNKIHFFDKKILVPFGEFLPFRKYLKFLYPITGEKDFSIGNKKRIIQLNKYINFIPIICYEIIFFNDLINNYNRSSPLLINLTNDAWFGKFSGPYQHFYLSLIRSAEFNKFLIRVSNNGITAVIDNYGQIIEFIPLNIKNQKNISIIIPQELYNYTRYHKLIYLFFVILFLFSLIINRKNAEYI